MKYSTPKAPLRLLNLSRLSYKIVFLFLFFSAIASSQNCTVNAGVPKVICSKTSFVLTGSAAFAQPFKDAPVWSQTAGSAVVLSPTDNSDLGSITSTVTGFTPGSSYTFKLQGRCQDGSTVFQTVVYTISTATGANAGADETGCPGTVITLSGNAPSPGEIVEWIRISGSGALPSSPNSPTNTVTLAAGTAGATVYRYTITGTCQTFDDVIITNTGGVTPVSAGPNQTLGNCYSVTASTTLAASFGGDNTNGQQGTWTLVSGPSTPNIGNINSSNTSVSNLLPGTYVFRWTVVGPCVNGTSTVSVTVPPPTQTRTQASSGDLVFCDARTSVLLQGNVPKFAGETVQWIKTSGPPVMIANANSPAATITGLVAGNIYTFTYTITNAATGCISVGNYNITYTLQPTISAPTNVFMACNDSVGTIPFTISGGNQTEWSLISGPAGCGIGGLTGTTPFATVASSPLQLVGLTHLGTYVIRLKRLSNTGIGGCGQAFTDVTIHVTKDPAAANAGTLQVLACNVTATSLAGNNPAVGGGIGIGSWSQVSGPNTAIFTNPSLYNAPISGLTNGKYTFRYIISGGLGNCPAAQDEVTVVVSNILPTVKPAGSNQTICASAPITLAATPPALNEIGTWTVMPSAGVVISDINNPAATVTGLDTPSTAYVFTWTVANGCGTASSNVTITTNSNQGPNPSIAGPDQCLFTGNTVALAANAPVSGETGTWTASGPASVTFSNAASNTSTATFAADGNYVLTWTLTRGGSCSSSASTLIVSKFPAVSSPVTASASSTEICSLTPTLTLTGSAVDAGATGTWTQVQGAGGIVITSSNSLSTSIAGLAPGAYKFRWTVARSSCNSGFADVTVNVATPPTTAMAMADISKCSGTTQILNATVPTAGTGSWSIVSAPNIPTFSDSSSPTATVSGLVSGTYVLRWTISSGPFCGSSSNNVNIFVTQPATAGDNQYLCNETTTTLTGNEGTSGAWTLVSQTPSGVAPAISQSGTNGAIISGLLPATYVFRYTLPSIGACPSTTADVTVNNSGGTTPANAGPDQDICLLNPATSTASVTLAANNPLLGIGTGIWTIESAPSGATPIFASTTTFNSQVTNLIPGIYVFSWAITNGNCSSALNKDEVRIIIYGDPSASTAGSTQTNACSGNVTLVGNEPVYGNGTWTQDSGPNTAIISQTNSAVTAVTGTVIGAYVFRWTISNGSPTCTSTSSTVSITVTSDPATIANAGIDQNICNNNGLTGGSTLLAGNNPTVGTGLWTKISGPGTLVFEDNTLFNTNIISGLTNGTYVLRWTITNGSCSGFDEMTITVADPPTPAVITTPTQSICLFDAVNLSANPVTLGTGQWSGTGPTIPVFLNPTSNSTSVSNLLVGEYTFVFTTSNGATCSPSVSTPITITILPLPTSSQAGPVQTACFGSYATMTANTPSTGTGTWTSSPAGIFSNINSPTSTFTGAPGVYQLTWTITSGSCTSATVTQVTILPAIDNNNISGNATICSGLTATISNANPALSGGNGTTYQYAWQQSIDGATFTTISGATGANFTTPALTNTTAANVLYSYRRLVTSGACATANNSNNITVTVLPQVAGNTLTTPTTTSFCGGSDPVAITGGAPIGGGGGAFTYVWQFSTDGTTYANIAGATSATYDPSAFTNTGNSILNFYYRRIATSSAGCQNTSNIIQLISNPVPLIANKTATVCGGTAFSVLPTNGSDVVPSGTTYSWSAPTMGSNITGGVSATGQTSILGTLVNNGTTAQTAVYSVTATANGCPSGIFSVTVTVNPKSTIADKTATVCANSSFSVTPGGGDVVLSGTTYSWSAPTGTGFSGGAAGSNASSISGTLLNTTNAVTTATYLVTASSVSLGSCPTTFPVTVTLNPRPVIANKTATICTGSTFTVAPSNGTDIVPSSTTYTWTQNSPVNLSGNSNQAVGQSSVSQTLTNNTNTPITIIYTVTPTSGAAGTCVGTTFTVTVTVNPTPIVANKTATICGGVAFTVTPTNGAGDVIPSSIRYAWSSPSGSGFSGGAARSNQTNINGTLTNTTNIPTTATYTVTPSTNTTPSCPGSNFTVTVTLNPRPRINAKTASICTGGTFSISPVNGSASDIVPAGTTYTWTQNSPSGITGNSNQAVAQSTISQTLTNSTNAAINVVYTVTPTSGAAGSCVGSTFTVTVTVNPTPIINAKSVYVCSGNALNYTPTSVSGETIPLGTNYTWTVTSVSGVSGASANSTGTTSINPILTLSNPNVAGSVVYNVTPIFATCTGNAFALNVMVNPIPPAPTAGTVTQPTCAVATGFFQITAYDNTKTYNFNPSSGVSISPTGLVTAGVGSYTFTVTNSGIGGCTSSSSSSIVVNAQPSTPAAPAVGAVTQPTCASARGTFQITAYDNSRTYTFSPAVISISATGLVTANVGTYTFTVDNAAGCTSPASSSIVVNAQPSTPTAPAVGGVTQPTCASARGTFQITAYDNSRTYTFSPAVVSISATGLVTANVGTYTFTVNNAAGCTSPASSSIVVIAQPATPTAPSVGVVTQPTCASSAGTFQIASYDNTRTYTFTPSVVSISSTGLVTANAGTYTFTVNNAAGCTSPASSSIVVNALPVTPAPPSVGAIAQPTCASATGTFQITDYDNTNMYNFTPAVVSISATGLVTANAGIYTFSVTNTVSGCTSVASANMVVNVQPPAPAAPEAGTVTQPTASQAIGTFQINAFDASRTYNFTPSVVSISATGLVTANAGTYTFTVDNVTGCLSADSLPVTVISFNVNSGNSGGVESESLGDIMSKQYVSRKKSSVPTEFVTSTAAKFTKEALVKESSSSRIGMSDLKMLQMFPSNLQDGDVAVISSPTDILDYTIAQEVLSVDFSVKGATKAVVLGVRTKDKVYNHTKASCDRLRSAEILNVKIIKIGGYNFLIQAIKQRNKVVEYAVSFAVGKNESDSFYSLQSNWYVKEYGVAKDVFNFQVWATTPSQTTKLVNDILNNLKASIPLNQKEIQKVPKTFVSKVTREGSDLVLKLKSVKKQQDVEITMDQNYSETNGYVERHNRLQSEFDQTLRIKVGDSFEFDGLVKVDGNIQDAFYHADGNWGLDYDPRYTLINKYRVSNNLDRIGTDDEMLINRDVHLEVFSENDYATLYKSLLPAQLPADYNEYKYVSFKAKGSGLIELGLIKSSVENWKHQYKSMINIGEEEQTYYVPFKFFTSSKSTEKINANDLTMLTFTFLPVEAKTKNLDLTISDVKFTKKAPEGYQNLLPTLKNQFIAYPNPSVGNVKCVLFSDFTTTATVSLYDISGKTVYSSEVKLNEGKNELDFNFNVPKGVMFLSITNGKTNFGTSKISFK